MIAMLRRWAVSGREQWRNVAPSCAYSHCAREESKLRRMCRRPRYITLLGSRYCHTECLEQALAELLRMRPVARREPAPHRVPLGLLLLSRQQLTADQLRSALAAQRHASSGEPSDHETDHNSNGGEKRIGAWLREFGFVTEQQVTAALARQWSCPLLQSGVMEVYPQRFPSIPARLLESSRMMPVEVVEATKTLLMAFSEGIDYTALYAIEQMLGYRTEPCLVSPSILQESLQSLLRHRCSSEVVFDGIQDTGECARIIANYAATTKAEEVRVARCSEHFWVRLERLRQPAVTLVLETN